MLTQGNKKAQITDKHNHLLGWGRGAELGSTDSKGTMFSLDQVLHPQRPPFLIIETLLLAWELCPLLLSLSMETDAIESLSLPQCTGMEICLAVVTSLWPSPTFLRGVRGREEKLLQAERVETYSREKMWPLPLSSILRLRVPGTVWISKCYTVVPVEKQSEYLIVLLLVLV